METILPYVEVEDFNPAKIMQNIEKAGRTCYKSEDKITEDSANKFIAGIIKRGHETVIEHEKITARVICDRGVTHEIVRHRLASYSQESTRYVNYSSEDIKFIIPSWTSIPTGVWEAHETLLKVDAIYKGPLEEPFEISVAEKNWVLSCLHTELMYKTLIKQGWNPQKARSVLPNSLKTEIVMTMNLREWRHFFKLRCSPKAHPQMIEVANMLKDIMEAKLPVIFGDI